MKLMKKRQDRLAEYFFQHTGLINIVTEVSVEKPPELQNGVHDEEYRLLEN